MFISQKLNFRYAFYHANQQEMYKKKLTFYNEYIMYTYFNKLKCVGDSNVSFKSSILVYINFGCSRQFYSNIYFIYNTFIINKYLNNT